MATFTLNEKGRVPHEVAPAPARVLTEATRVWPKGREVRFDVRETARESHPRRTKVRETRPRVLKPWSRVEIRRGITGSTGQKSDCRRPKLATKVHGHCGAIPLDSIANLERKSPMNAASVLQKASKYAGLDDDQVVPAVLDHPDMEKAMRRFNADMRAACAEIEGRDDLIEHDANGMA